MTFGEFYNSIKGFKNLDFNYVAFVGENKALYYITDFEIVHLKSGAKKIIIHTIYSDENEFNKYAMSFLRVFKKLNKLMRYCDDSIEVDLDIKEFYTPDLENVHILYDLSKAKGIGILLKTI